MDFKTRLRTLILLGDTESAEGILGLFGAVIGCALGWPRTPEQLTAPPYTVLTQTGWPVYGWGFIFLVLGALRLVGVVLRMPHLRKALTLLSVPLWTFTGYAFWAATHDLLLPAFCLLMASLGGWIRVRFYIDELLTRVPTRRLMLEEWLRRMAAHRER